MNTKVTLSIAAVILGLVSGNSALVAAQSAKPPLDWGAVQFSFIGCVLGMIFVIGIQILRSNPKYANFAITGMLAVSLYILSSGAIALIISGTISPPSIFMLVIGIGALIGVGISSLIYKWRHEPTS